jgi:hypothetical protein
MEAEYRAANGVANHSYQQTTGNYSAVSDIAKTGTYTNESSHAKKSCSTISADVMKL